jgi:hypothetical protein
MLLLQREDQVIGDAEQASSKAKGYVTKCLSVVALAKGDATFAANLLLRLDKLQNTAPIRRDLLDAVRSIASPHVSVEYGAHAAPAGGEAAAAAPGGVLAADVALEPPAKRPRMAALGGGSL